MKATICYQDFIKNYECYDGEGLIVDEEKSTRIYEVDSVELGTEPDKEKMADAIFRKMNTLCIPVGHEDRHLFVKAGHTSMSIGDYIVFEDGEIWVCAPVGWKVMRYV